MAAILQMGCTIQCPHGGTVSVVPSNQKVKLDSMAALLENDTFTIAGCPFMMGSSPHPCVTIQWVAPATRVKVNGTAVLLESSVGLCKAADQMIQGPAIVSGVQTRVKGM